MSYLKKLKAALIENKTDINEALYKDMRKSGFECLFLEFDILINEINYFIKNIHILTKRKSVSPPMFLFNTKAFIYPEPYGKILIISPWNFPFQLTFLPLIGAIAAGNKVVVKPSEISCNSEKIIKKIITEVFPDDLVSVVIGGADVTTRLLANRYDLIFFTGSPEKGKIIMHAAAENLTPVVLELGGKCPAIVEDLTNIDVIAAKICKGKFIASGQGCVLVDYVLVNDKYKNALIQSIIKQIKIFYGEDSRLSASYGRIINQRNCERLVGYLQDLNVVYGGKYDLTENYLSPTIVENIPADHPIMRDEIFGPILPIVSYSSLDEAISFVHAKEKPLALYFFSNDKNKTMKIINESSAGGISINDIGTHFLTWNLPFGGIGYSGMGSYHRKASFDTFTHYKPVSITWSDLLFKFKIPPYINLGWVAKLLHLIVK